MAAYILRRSIQSIVTIFGILTIVFFLVRLSGDPAVLLLPAEATAEQVANLRTELGLDEPLLVQYGHYVADAVTGDLGTSLRQRVPALQLIMDRLPATLELALSAFAIGMVLAFALGISAELSRGNRLREAFLWMAFFRQAIPVFWFGLLMILIFSVQLDWLPALGRGTWRHLLLPAITLGTYQLALFLRLFNSAFAEEQSQDYVRTALSKGQGRRLIVLRHMLPNALLPIVTIAGINLGVLLSGTVITETVFSWPGVGRLIVQSVHQRDYPVIQAGILVVSVMFVFVNFVVDVLYAYLDPRVRLS